MRSLKSMVCLLMTAAVLMVAQAAMAKTIRATPLKVVPDDEGQKVVVIENGANAVVYLKSSNPNFDMLADMIQISAKAKVEVSITLDEDFPRVIKSIAK